MSLDIQTYDIDFSRFEIRTNQIDFAISPGISRWISISSNLLQHQDSEDSGFEDSEDQANNTDNNNILQYYKDKDYDKIISELELEKKEIEGECLVCYENKELHIETECKHSFCSDCIIKWKYEHHHNSCPYCRENLKLKYFKKQ